MDTSVLADHQKLMFIYSLLTMNIMQGTYQERWLIGIDGKSESRESQLLARIDDDELNCSDDD